MVHQFKNKILDHQSNLLIKNGEKEAVKVVPAQQGEIKGAQRRNEEHHEAACLKQAGKQASKLKADIHHVNKPKE